METFHEEKGHDKRDEDLIELVSEYGNGEAGLDNGVTGTVMKAFCLAEAKRTEEYSLDESPNAEDCGQNHVCDGKKRELGVRKMDDGHVKIALGKDGVGENGCC